MDDFRYRWNNYKLNSRIFHRKESCIQEYLHGKFLSPGHRGLLKDTSVTLIYKTDGSVPKKRQEYWIKTLKTMAPCDLNIEDSVYSYPYVL